MLRPITVPNRVAHQSPNTQVRNTGNDTARPRPTKLPDSTTTTELVATQGESNNLRQSTASAKEAEDNGTTVEESKVLAAAAKATSGEILHSEGLLYLE